MRARYISRAHAVDTRYIYTHTQVCDACMRARAPASREVGVLNARFCETRVGFFLLLSLLLLARGLHAPARPFASYTCNACLSLCVYMCVTLSLEEKLFVHLHVARRAFLSLRAHRLQMWPHR